MSRKDRWVIVAWMTVLVPLLAVNLASAGQVEEGTAARGFALKDTSGQVRTLKAERGKVVVVNFWATWCGPCRVELPRLHEIYKKHRNRKLEVFAIAVDNEQTVGRVKSMVQRMGLEFPILLDTDNRVVMSYNPNGIIPFTVIMDHEGNVRHVHPGYTPGDERIVEQEILKLIVLAEGSKSIQSAEP